MIRARTSQLVSFKPYMGRLQNLFSNQYYVVLQAVPRKNASFQRVNIQTELSTLRFLHQITSGFPVRPDEGVASGYVKF